MKRRSEGELEARVRGTVRPGTSPASEARREPGYAHDSEELLSLLRAAFEGVPNIELAFVFGSVARSDDGLGSDVDVFVIQRGHSDRAHIRRLTEAVLILDRPVNPIRYSPQALHERLTDSRHPAAPFVRRVLKGPKIWIVGDDDDLRAMVPGMEGQ